VALDGCLFGTFAAAPWGISDLPGLAVVSLRTSEALSAPPQASTGAPYTNSAPDLASHLVPQGFGSWRFVHIPKNAGTYVEEQMRERGMPVTPIFEHGLKLTGRSPGAGLQSCSRVHVPPASFAVDGRLQLHGAIWHGETNPAVWKGEDGDVFLFATLKHPYERAVSQYLWLPRLLEKMGYQITVEDMNRFIQDSIRNASMDDRACRLADDSLWKGFYTEHREIKVRLSFCGRYQQDCHWLPQADYVFTQNRSHRLVSVLLHAYNISRELPALVDGAHDAYLPRVTSTADQWERRPRRKEKDAWMCALSNQSRDLLDTHYAEDFALFGFPKWRGRDGPCSADG